MRLLPAAAVAVSLVLSACTYNVKPTSAPAVNIYSSYDDKIAGRWAVIVDPGTEFRRDIKPSTYVCSAHTYPFESGTTMKASVMNTLSNVFEETVVRTSTPSAEEMASGELAGVVLVRLDNFQPRLACQMGFWSGTCTATADISFGLEVSGPEGRLFGTSVGSSKTTDGDAGGACGDAANVFSEAYRLALRDALERMAERLSNAQKIRSVRTVTSP